MDVFHLDFFAVLVAGRSSIVSDCRAVRKRPTATSTPNTLSLLHLAILNGSRAIEFDNRECIKDSLTKALSACLSSVFAGVCVAIDVAITTTGSWTVSLWMPNRSDGAKQHNAQK